MGYTLGVHRQWEQAPRQAKATSRRGRKCVLEVSRLEERALLSGPGDTTAPTTSAMIVSGTLGMNNFYTTPVTVDLTASDPDDAANTLTTFFSVNGSAYVMGNTVTLTQNGTDVVNYFSKDPAGNAEMPKTLTVNIDTTAPVISSLVASPNILWPPNHSFRTVTVSGVVSDASGPLPSKVHFVVMDQNGQVQPHGAAIVQADGSFSFQVMLQASRTGQEKSGRLYTIVVSAVDQAGNMGTGTTFVLVPHDMGHAFNLPSSPPTTTTGGGQGPTGGDTGDSGQGDNGGTGHGRGHGHGHGHGQAQSIGDQGNFASGDEQGGGGNGNGNGHGHGHGNGNDNGNGNGHGKH
jgi:hypothetical protein